MANYATNIFYASTENQNDLNKIEAFLDDNFSCYANKYGNSVDAEFPSRNIQKKKWTNWLPHWKQKIKSILKF
jgi:hypothetical protein